MAKEDVKNGEERVLPTTMRTHDAVNHVKLLEVLGLSLNGTDSNRGLHGTKLEGVNVHQASNSA